MHLSDEYPVKYEGERLPPPIVADLNGDGKKEVLVATHDAKIQVLFLFFCCSSVRFCYFAAGFISVPVYDFFFWVISDVGTSQSACG